MNILGIVLHKSGGITCVSPEVLLYESLKSQLSDYTRVVVVVYRSDEGDNFFFNLTDLVASQPMSFEDGSVVSTWDTFLDYISALDDDIFASYEYNILVPTHMELPDNKFIITPFTSKNTSQLNIYGVENDITFDVVFGDHNNPLDARNSGLEAMSSDLVLTTSSSSIDLYNSIPIVNGAVFYPNTWSNLDTSVTEMFMYNAGKWVMKSNWSTNDVKTVGHTHIFDNDTNGTIAQKYTGGADPMTYATTFNKGLMLLDLSSVGDIEIIRLSNCTDTSIVKPNDMTSSINVINTEEGNRGMTSAERALHKTAVQKISDIFWRKGSIEHQDLSYYTIQFTLPANTSNGTPVVCLFGRFFFVGQEVFIQDIGTGYQITVTLQRRVLEDIMMSNLQWYSSLQQSEYFVENDIDTTLDHLFDDIDKVTYNNDFVQDLSSRLFVPYVIMIHNSGELAMTYSSPILDLGNGSMLFPKNCGGLLLNKITREIVDYTKIWYDNSTLVQCNQTRPLLTIDRDFHKLTDNELVYNTDNNVNFNKYSQYRDMDEYVLIDIGQVGG